MQSTPTHVTGEPVGVVETVSSVLVSVTPCKVLMVVIPGGVELVGTYPIVKGDGIAWAPNAHDSPPGAVPTIPTTSLVGQTLEPLP